MKRISCFLALLCLALSSCGQQSVTKPLTVGDTIPFIILTDVVNFPVSKIQLSSYKGKLLILDFWATWCNSCVRTFPKLDSLQTQFRKQLQFVLINNFNRTGNTKESVQRFFKNKKALARNLRHIPVVTDTTARITQLFPCKFIPHYIWVNPAGIIIAITGAEEVTAANIRTAIRGRPLSLPIKTE